MKVAVVDDDKNIAHLLESYLKRGQYEVEVFHDGISFYQFLKGNKPDLILLDVMLPGINGFELKEKHIFDIPVIFLTAKSDVEDKIKGLKLGADDYITKPFDGLEVLARVEAVLRRVNPIEHQILTLPGVVIDKDAYAITYHNKVLHLPQKEFELFVFMTHNINHVFTREQLIEKIWGIDSLCDNRTVDVHVKRLRSKFTENDPWEFKTIWGVGYKLEM
ncbi:MAG: response regulator transcription factor [Clostridia bacterium]|nr:response regulator transcription factor [Clostridia bacterium]